MSQVLQLSAESLCCVTGVDANLESVSVVVEVSGLPPVTVPAADIPGVAAPPPPPSSKSASIAPIAGGIAGSVVLVGEPSLLCLHLDSPSQ